MTMRAEWRDTRNVYFQPEYGGYISANVRIYTVTLDHSNWHYQRRWRTINLKSHVQRSF